MSTSQTWSKDTVPYFMYGVGVTVSTGTTLTINPGVVIKFDKVSNPRIYNKGIFNVIGGSFTGTNITIASSSNVGLAAMSGTISIGSSIFRNNTYGIQILTSIKSCVVTTSTFANNSSYGFYQNTGPTSTAINN